MKINWKANFKTSPILFNRIAEWSGIKLRHFRVVAGELPEHKPDIHEINIGISGTLSSIKHLPNGSSRKRYNTAGGDNVCLTQAGQPISASWNEIIENIAIDIEPTFLNRVAAENHFSSQFELVEKPEMKDNLIHYIALALLNEAKSETSSGKLYVDSLIQTLSLHLLKNYSTGTTRENLNGGLSGYKLRRVTEFINENLEADLSLSEIASVADLSQFHFARAFRRTTGQTPQQYLMQRRIERAKELLAKEELPLVEVSLRTGFKNQSHFTTLFRKYTKLTPKIWRELKLA